MFLLLKYLSVNMSFVSIDNEKELEFSYNSADDDIVREFYNRVLSEAVRYDRISGFFNSTSLAVAAYGMTNFIKNEGHMRLLCSAQLSSEDLNSINNSDDLKDIIDKNFLNEFSNLKDEFVRNHVELLGWMIANDFLEIKIGVLKNQDGEYQGGILHSKKGILYDGDGESISFGGSVNETAFGWKINIESLDVFYSWKSPKEYICSHEREFNNLWNGYSKSIEIIDVPEATRKKLIKIAPKNLEELKLVKNIKKEIKPKLRDYQKVAVQSWINNDFKGIFSMATGTGKTITALSSLDYLYNKKNKLLTIIVCPQKHLLSQWEENIKKFNFSNNVLFASGDNKHWKQNLLSYIGDLNSNISSKLIIITTFNTFSSESFVEIINYYDGETFLIVDEVHGIGSLEFRKGLLEQYTFRLGLSATPAIEDDLERTDLVYNYFNNIIFEYDLETAIKNGFLTHYNYYPEFIDLNEDELKKYKVLTLKIAQIYSKKNKSINDEINLNKALIQRRNIINNAEEKMIFIKEFLIKNKDIQDLIIYCTKKQMKIIENLLQELKISYSPFTGEEGTKKDKNGLSQRDKILKYFAKGHYQILLAMKCLDEGVDVPSTQTAILLASTLNSRQHIQRRGRILRKSPGKEIANIYDLIVFPNIKYETDAIKTILLNEKVRYDEYAHLADNYIECSKKITDRVGGI